jgi:hypothetical protein
LNKNFTTNFSATLDFLRQNVIKTRGLFHTNILAVYDIDQEGDATFITMELLDGMRFDDYLREHRISDQQAWSIIDGACQGLMAHTTQILFSLTSSREIYITHPTRR